MCLGTVYVHSAEGRKEIMREVARLEAEGLGFWLINLFGEKKFIEGTVHCIDLMEEHFVLLNPLKPL
jgi:predicted RNA-binding protein